MQNIISRSITVYTQRTILFPAIQLYIHNANNYFKQLFNRAVNINLEFEREKLASFGNVKFGPSVNQFFSRTNEVETWKFRINKQYENILSSFSKIPIVPSGPNAELL